MSFDQILFEVIHQDAANAWFDWLLPVYRDKKTWAPLYLLIAYFLFRNHGWRRSLYLLICIAAVITVADQLAAQVLKPWVGRLRPCADATVAATMRTLVGCGGKYSFPSNHATNHFALAGLLALTLFRDVPWARWALYLWAASICLAQVYVGKHWPTDVIAGGLLGYALAWAGVLAYRKVVRGRPIDSFTYEAIHRAKSPPSSHSRTP